LGIEATVNFVCVAVCCATHPPTISHPTYGRAKFNKTFTNVTCRCSLLQSCLNLSSYFILSEFLQFVIFIDSCIFLMNLSECIEDYSRISYRRTRQRPTYAIHMDTQPCVELKLEVIDIFHQDLNAILPVIK
jgi:hypothetical protein